MGDVIDHWLPADVPVDAVGAQGWNALDGDLLLPVLVLKEPALRHNLELMARFCAHHGVSLAPHGKTSMSPQLVRRQLDAGAWALTVATPAQARAFRAFGASRLLLANQVVDPAGLRWVASELARDPALELYCLADSEASVELLAGAAPPAGRLRVLVELGHAGGRTGCRTAAEATRVAAAVRAAGGLRLAGVECFEGTVHAGDERRAMDEVDALLGRVRELAGALGRAGAFDQVDEVVVSAGGSTYFDRVIRALAGEWGMDRPVRVVLRSGCYLTHDHGGYMRMGPLGGRLAEWPPFRPALELWGAVHSQPEPGLAVVGFGKRDTSYDMGLPTPLRLRGRDGTVREAAGMEVFRLNDQHAYVRLGADAPVPAVGDLLGCGIAHPCTIFDKWRLIPLVDDGYRVVGAVQTLF